LSAMARRWLLAFLAAAPHAAADKCDERYPTADCFPDHAAPSCKATCFGATCDHWDGSIWGSCAVLESMWHCDCSGCACDGCPQGDCDAPKFDPEARSTRVFSKKKNAGTWEIVGVSKGGSRRRRGYKVDMPSRRSSETEDLARRFAARPARETAPRDRSARSPATAAATTRTGQTRRRARGTAATAARTPARVSSAGRAATAAATRPRRPSWRRNTTPRIRGRAGGRGASRAVLERW